jgi:hypothetical protein
MFLPESKLKLKMKKKNLFKIKIRIHRLDMWYQNENVFSKWDLKLKKLHCLRMKCMRSEQEVF